MVYSEAVVYEVRDTKDFTIVELSRRDGEMYSSDGQHVTR